MATKASFRFGIEELRFKNSFIKMQNSDKYIKQDSACDKDQVTFQLNWYWEATILLQRTNKSNHICRERSWVSVTKHLLFQTRKQIKIAKIKYKPFLIGTAMLFPTISSSNTANPPRNAIIVTSKIATEIRKLNKAKRGTVLMNAPVILSNHIRVVPLFMIDRSFVLMIDRWPKVIDHNRKWANDQTEQSKKKTFPKHG